MSNLSLNAQRLLLRAAELINVRASWSKGFYEQGDNYCAIGALQRADREIGGGYNAFTQAQIALTAELPEYSDDYYTCVEGFNDHPNTKYADVKALFCRTVSKHVDDPSLLEDNKDGGSVTKTV